MMIIMKIGGQIHLYTKVVVALCGSKNCSSLVSEWCHFASAADDESGNSGVKTII